MKRSILVLTILLLAATAYGQDKGFSDRGLVDFIGSELAQRSNAVYEPITTDEGDTAGRLELPDFYDQTMFQQDFNLFVRKYSDLETYGWRRVGSAEWIFSGIIYHASPGEQSKFVTFALNEGKHLVIMAVSDWNP